jgi:alpha-L-fucosidase 2
MSESINSGAGRIDVDYARYLSKHDVVFNHPITDPASAAPVGNGRVGAMVWNDDGLRMQISGVDTSEETAFSAGLIHLYTTSPLESPQARFQQRLSIYDGILTISYDPNLTVTLMGAPDSEVMGIHVSDRRPVPSPVMLDLTLWNVSQLGGGDVPDISAWRSVATYADSGGIGLSRGQTDANNFGYTLAATVEDARFVAQAPGGNVTRLIISSSRDYTIWIACASRLNAPAHDSVAQARTLLRNVAGRGYRATLADYERWWHAFWRKSFVQYSTSTGDGDYLENLYYLYTYVIAAGSYGNYPFHFINGVFSAAGDANSRKWSVGYWYWNERDVFSSFFASNHLEIPRVLNRLYSRNSEALATYTKNKYHVDGIWVPETMGWDGNARFTDNSEWAKNILSTGAEVAENMYAEYAYANDGAYLKSTAYPFIKAVAQFYVGTLAYNAETGRYYVAMSNAHETYWKVHNAITDMAAIRSLFPIAIDTSENLNLDADLRDRWRMILANLAAYPLADDGSRYAPHAPPPVPYRNHENVTCELIWPYGVTGIGAPDYQIALNSWMRRLYPYGDIWANDAVQAARLGLGDYALNGMRFMIQTYQSYSNGLTNDANGTFEYLGTHLSVINESLLQSYNDRIRVFPAPPSDPQFVGKFTLLARGGFLVSSEYEQATVKYVALKSLYGNAATIENPWVNEPVRVRNALNNAIVLTTARDEFKFGTAANSVYIIERIRAPLRGFRHERITGTPNDGAKRLQTGATLGN